MTFKELKEKYKGSAFTKIAGEYIPGGFARKGWDLYGDTDDMYVMSYEVKGDTVHAVLGNARLRNKI